jgi:hypothetical protein
MKIDDYFNQISVQRPRLDVHEHVHVYAISLKLSCVNACVSRNLTFES